MFKPTLTRLGRLGFTGETTGGSKKNTATIDYLTRRWAKGPANMHLVMMMVIYYSQSLVVLLKGVQVDVQRLDI